MVATMALHAPATADPGNEPTLPGATKHTDGDIRNVGPNLNDGKKQPLEKSSITPQLHSLATKAAQANAQVGDDKVWLAEDDTTGSIYAKTYTLRGIGQHIQVWVADNRAFPAGDCRNDLGLTDVTDEQVDNFVKEFDDNIYPQESATFSVPPARDGSGAVLPGLLGLPDDYYQVGADQADDIAVLVDNVKDANYYDPSTPDGQTYIAGFFYSVFNEYVDRNVMTIDVYDWLHRTGANPPDDTSDPAYIQCAQDQGSSRPYGAPRPHLYEGTFAHEYQHLLEYYQDPDEVSWVNEGLSDWAQTLVGYVDPTLPPDSPTADSHLSCFMGYQPPSFGGPENSLTLWGDQGGPEILCDYGAAYSFMSYLHSRFGDGFMSKLHKDPGNGLQGLQDVLADYPPDGMRAEDVVHQWMATMALDHAIDQKGGRLVGGVKRNYTTDELDAKINWDTAQAYDTPGAPPNGSDYVRLRDGKGSYLSAGQVSSISFDGASALEPQPLEWSVSSTPPDSTSGVSCGTTPAGTGAAALYSGCGNDLDRAAVRQVSVPANGGTLSFDALWQTEQDWDFGFVQVSDDGGRTWHSLATQDTTSDHDPGAIGTVVSNLPGFSGDSGGWKTETADLSAYAGKDVLISFRYVTDPATVFAGFWVRNVQVAGVAVPTDTLDGWMSATQAHPVDVAGWTVQLVGYDQGRAWYHTLHVDGDFHGALATRRDVRRALGRDAGVVAAIVTYDDPSETSTQQARYTLKVNGVTQPGG
jgi:hypothetical protein